MPRRRPEIDQPEQPDAFERLLDHRLRQERRRDTVELTVSLCILALFAVLALWPELLRPASLDDGLLVVLAWLTLLFSMRLARALDEGDRPGVESAWSGLGGGFGGWRLTRSAIFLLAALAFALLLASRF